MALIAGQVQIRDLVMGADTQFKVLSDFDPFSQGVRADQGGPRAWNHGSWSGAEWQQQRIVPLTVVVHGDAVTDVGSTIERRHELAAAFQPVGDTATDVQLRFHRGGREYVMFGRPRDVTLDGRLIGTGKAYAECFFAATDPLIYSGLLHTTDPIPLPQQVGGLSVPFTVPFSIGGMLLGGSAELVNDGTAPSPLRLRIDGPVPEPFVTVQGADGSVNTLRFHLDLPSGQWLIVNTGARTAFLNGLPQASRRGSVTAEPDWPLLPPGMSTIRFGASEHNDQATLLAEYRSAWW